MSQTEEKIEAMEDDMKNKFPKTEDMRAQVEVEKGRMQDIKKFIQTYKNGLSKQITYHSMKHDTKKNQIL